MTIEPTHMNDPVSTMVERYKTHLKDSRLTDELYKWKLLKQFYGRPNLDAPNLGEEIKGINYYNLIYQTPRAVIKDIAERAGDEYREALKAFFDEEVPLAVRLNEFRKEVQRIFEKIKTDEKFSPYHDERTMATMLTFHNPKKYTFYKDSYYRKYCDLLGVGSRKTGEKYLHYLELVEKLVTNYIKKDEELLGVVDTLLSDDCYRDPNRMILAQDVLYQMLDKGDKSMPEIVEESEVEQPSAPFVTHPLNTILYGPPGTGKTYHSIDKAVEIAEGHRASDHASAKVKFDELRSKGQIEFVTFHQNYAYEDFMVGIRPDVDNDQLRFHTQKGVFYQIARRARENYDASLLGRSRRTFDQVFSEFVEPLERGEAVSVTMASGGSYKITDVTETSIHFDKPSGTSKHTLSISTLEDTVNGLRDLKTNGLKPYYIPLVELIRERREMGQSASELKRYVLIIDEINRANISKVFGELITLLEEDKRLGGENELRVTLPDGEKDFSVPPNLYLLGTMNTADKSIALIDIALRRRFDFVGYYPQYDQLPDEAANVLRTINSHIFEKKKSPDYLIGHAYFMGDASLDSVLRNKVIPLLTEYFAGKTDIISEIFSDTPWSVIYDTDLFRWNILEK